MYKTTRICKQCGKAFTPEAGRQIFCCAACREKYKKRSRQLKKEAQNHALSLEDTRAALDNKTHLSISEAAAYLGISRPTVYARIKEGELVPVRFATKTLRIPIEQLRIDTAKLPQASNGDFSILISKEDAIARYEITSAWLYRKCRSEGIRPKIIKGKAFFPKKDLDRMFPPKVTYNPDDWYNADDLIKDEGFTRKYITNFIRIKKIPYSMTESARTASRASGKEDTSTSASRSSTGCSRTRLPRFLRRSVGTISVEMMPLSIITLAPNALLPKPRLPE